MHELNKVPEELLTEILHYTVYLKSKHFESLENSLMSQQALAEDWLREEEDAAWQNL